MTDYYTATEVSETLVGNTLFTNFPVSRNLQISVILPVRNEEDNLIRALDALRRQIDGLGNRLSYNRYEILLLANNCTDNSVTLALAYQRKYPGFALHIEEINLPKETAHIGMVRRLLMDAAYERLSSTAGQNGVIASTDSDSQVDPQWVYQTLNEIGKGNDVVGGRILTTPEKSSFRIYYLRDITYKHLVSKVEDMIDPVKNDRWPRHFQCFGASFAVTCKIYELSGRLPVIPFLEDMAFHKALIRVDARIRLSPLVRVFTSSRTEGRVDFGLSIQLKQWGEMNDCRNPLMVESAESLIIKLRARKMLRDFWQAKKNGTISSQSNILWEACEMLNLDYQWLLVQFENESYFGCIWEKIDDQLRSQSWSSIWPPCNVVDVIVKLREEISRFKTTQPAKSISS